MSYFTQERRNRGCPRRRHCPCCTGGGDGGREIPFSVRQFIIAFASKQCDTQTSNRRVPTIFWYWNSRTFQGLSVFQGLAEWNSRTFKHSSSFQVLLSLELRRKKFKYFQGLSRMRENPGINEMSAKEVAKEFVEINEQQRIYCRGQFEWLIVSYWWTFDVYITVCASVSVTYHSNSSVIIYYCILRVFRVLSPNIQTVLQP